MLDENLAKFLSTEAQHMCDTVISKGFDVVVLISEHESYSTLTLGSPAGLAYLSSNPDVLTTFQKYCEDYGKAKLNKYLDIPLVNHNDVTQLIEARTSDTPRKSSGKKRRSKQPEDVLSRSKESKSRKSLQHVKPDEPEGKSESSEDNSYRTDLEAVSIVPDRVEVKPLVPEATIDGMEATQNDAKLSTGITDTNLDGEEDWSDAETVIEDYTDMKEIKAEANALPSFECAVCHISFVSKAGLIGHKKFHKKSQNSKSDQKNSSSKKLQRRRPTHYSCEICDETFTSWYLRKNHLVTHGPKEFFCDKCDSSFHFQTELRIHNKIHEAPTKHKCHLCPKEYEHKNRLNEHLKSHDSANYVRCDICDKSIFKSVLHKHMIIHRPEKNFMCQVCGKAYVSKTHLRNHLIIHDDVRKYECRYCNASFKKSDTLKVHENAVHTKECKYMCDTCGVQYLRKSSLRLHQQRHIYGSYRVKCRYCQTVFRNHASLMTHIKNVHTKEDLAHEKPTLKQCKQCGKVFGQLKPYRIHLDMHAGIKRYSCNVCGKAFGSPTNLREHKKIHDGTINQHRCEVCNAKLRNAKRLRMHMETHMNMMRQDLGLGHVYANNEHKIEHNEVGSVNLSLTRQDLSLGNAYINSELQPEQIESGSVIRTCL